MQPGDTLPEIADRFGLGLSQVIAANPGIQPHRIGIGKRITLPAAVRSPRTQTSGYASPPLNSIQREPQATPQSSYTPQYNSAPALIEPEGPSHKVLIKIPKSTSFGEIADKVGTDIDTLNRLNHCALSATTRIPANGTLYVPSEQ